MCGAAKFRGTTVMNAKVCDRLSKAYGWCIKQNRNNLESARLQVLNMINHYFGDHTGCREYEIEDEDGKLVTWCGFHRVGPNYKFKALKNGQALDPVFKKKIKKVRGQPAPDPPYEEIQFKEEILKLFQPFIEMTRTRTWGTRTTMTLMRTTRVTKTRKRRKSSSGEDESWSVCCAGARRLRTTTTCSFAVTRHVSRRRTAAARRRTVWIPRAKCGREKPP